MTQLNNFKNGMRGNSARHPLSFVTYIAIIALVIWVLLRVVLWLEVGISQLSFGQTLHTFALGAWFDMNALAYFVVPWLIFSILLPNRWRIKNWMQKTRWVLAWVVSFGLIFGAVSEYIFWQEFTTRFNFIAVDYLIYTKEVIGNIRESYPVPLILLVIALVAALLVWLTSRFVTFKHEGYSLKSKMWMLIAAIILPVLSYKIANVDQMQVGTNNYASELSGNGLFSFSAAARRNELDYNKFYKTIPENIAQQLLANDGVNRNADAHAASMAGAMGPFTRKPKNVILISVESLSAEYLGIYGNKQNITPNLDKLASESLTFDKLFATGTRTVRGLDSLTVGVPPIPGQAIVHRPNNENLITMGSLLQAQGYNNYWIYGGYGVFDNMNTYFGSNGYKVIDRTDFDAKTISSENVWGVDDESLFNNAIKIFDANEKSGKPFYAHIMTTSNHRPYTFPQGRVDLPQGSREGAVKYTDYAIGKLISDAKTKPWFKDTLFVIVADHCASVAGKTKLPVDKYHIPLFFYAPDMLPAGHYTRLASQIDIVPTLLDVLGLQGSNRFYGQSLFDALNKNIAARAFISNYQELGYYKNDLLTVLSPKQKVQAYNVDAATLDSTPTTTNGQLADEAVAYYQTAASDFKKGKLKLSP